jgi:class 3 adenylate cyclase/HAMP domain-containing protein
MSIRAKIVLVVLPLIITPLVLIGVISTLSARNGITAVAAGLLQFKAEQLVTYAEGQWNLLSANGLESNAAYVEASKAAVESFAKSLVRSQTESIFALAADGTVSLRSADFTASPQEMEALKALRAGGASGWQKIRIAGVDRVAHLAGFTPFSWTFFVTEEAATFYRSTDAIVRQTGYVLAAALLASVILLLLFARYLTRPLQQVADAMTEIIATNDLSRRVEVLYKDETGRLGHTFNLMSEELGKAYEQIKSYALHAAVAQTKEQKLRTVFQKYVPKSVIDQFISTPEQMLIGESRILALLFSDVRGFTGISEKMQPDEIVESLNQYFGRTLDITTRRGGPVDTYIGDAIMAYFGAPVKHEDDDVQSVLAGLDMLDALEEFNSWQKSKGRLPWQTGIGINYGIVTVGNIGSQKKMDYTVIGDMVNLASRLEGLTKKYHAPLIVSESVHGSLHRKIGDDAPPHRLLDKVAVKGRSTGWGIYEVKRELVSNEQKAWKTHEEATALYYERKFEEAGRLFTEILSLLPQDYCARLFLSRSQAFIRTPPPPGWNGVEEMTEK